MQASEYAISVRLKLVLSSYILTALCATLFCVTPVAQEMQSSVTTAVSSLIHDFS